MPFRRSVVIGAAVAAGALTSYMQYPGLNSFTASAEAAVPTATTLPESAQLKLVQVVFRHGARTPLTHHIKELAAETQWDVCGAAYKAVDLDLRRRDGTLAELNEHDQKQVREVLPGGCSRGELTMIGQVQALHLGHWLRQRYIADLKFLPHAYQEGVFQGRTTNYSRTKATLRGVITGLYPDAQQPVHVTTSGDMDEILFADSKQCPHLKTLFKQAAVKTEEYNARPQHAQLVGQLKEIFPKAPEEFWDGKWTMIDAHDILTSLAAHGKAWPAGATPELYSKVEQESSRVFGIWSAPSLKDDHGHPIIQLTMGRLLHILVSNMEEAVSGQTLKSTLASPGQTLTSGQSQASEQPRPSLLRLYSGHDSTIFPLLVALGLDMDHWPPYLSNIAFELWQEPAPTGADAGSGARHFVRVLYNKSEIQLPGCKAGEALELGEFKDRVVGSFLLSEQAHELACSVPLQHSTSMPEPQTQPQPQAVKPQEAKQE